MNATTFVDAIPATVSPTSNRYGGLANDVEAVNQYAGKM